MHVLTSSCSDERIQSVVHPLGRVEDTSVPGAHLESECRPRLFTSGMGLVLGGRRPVVLTGHADASWADDQATQRSSQGYTFSLGSGSVSWRSTRSSSVLSSSCEAEIYAGAMAAQELRWLTYLLTDLGEQPRSPPVLYVDNKAMLALCREHRQEHRTKHIALRYFLARELQQRGQLRLAYVASEANTADIFTKALAPGDHQRFCTLLACLLCLTGLVFLLVPNSFASSFILVSSHGSVGQPTSAASDGVVRNDGDDDHGTTHPNATNAARSQLCVTISVPDSESTLPSPMQLKPQRPPCFDPSQRGGPTVQAWLFMLNVFFDAFYVSEDTAKIRYAVSLLGGPAMDWWRDIVTKPMDYTTLPTREGQTRPWVPSYFVEVPQYRTWDAWCVGLCARFEPIAALIALRGVTDFQEILAMAEKLDFFHRPRPGSYGTAEPPLEQPPLQQPPLEQPPLQQPPLEQPPLQQPPLEQPPLQQPPLQQPPLQQPPPEQPPLQQPPPGAATSAAAAPGAAATAAAAPGAAASGAVAPTTAAPGAATPTAAAELSLYSGSGLAVAAVVRLLFSPLMQLQRRPRVSLTPQQLREWYASWGCRGGRSGSRPGVSSSAAACSGQVQLQRRSRLVLSPQQLREWYAQRDGSRGMARCPYVIRTGARTGQPCGMLGHAESRCFARLSDAWRTEFGDAAELPDWVELLRLRVDIYTLDYDAILTAMYALPTSDEGDCYLCVPPDPGIEAAALGAGEAAALGASASAAPGAGESALSGTTSALVFHTFTLDSGASRSFFQDRTTLTPLSRPVAVSLADPSGGPVLARFSTLLPCSAAPSGTLQRVTHCTCARTGRHLATITRRPGSSLYTLSTESPPVPASGQTLLWHHRLGHPSLPRLRGMASRVLVSGLPRSLPPLPPGPAPTCVPCVEGRQRAAHHSSEFPPTEAPLQPLHMDVWGPARVRGQGHERYFLLVVDDYSRYTTMFPLRSKGDVTEVLIAWIRAARLQLRESFGSDFPVLRLHSDRGGEFSSARLGAFCRAQGIRETFTLPASPQQNGIAERRIGMVMDVAQTSPTLRWTGKVGDASAFWVWGSRAFVRDLSADKLSPRAVPYVFLDFPPDAPRWQFYHPTSRRVLSSQDVTFDESVHYYRLFPYRTAPLPPPPLFLAPGPPPVDPLPPQGPAPSGVSQVDGVEPVEVAVDSGAARGAEPVGAGSGGAESGGAEPGGAESWGAELEGAEPGGAEPGGAESGGPEPGGVEPGGAESARVAFCSASSRRELLSPQELREWFARRWSRAAEAGGPPVAPGPGGARTGGTGAVGTGGATTAAGVGPAGASGAAGAGATGGVGAGVGAAVASGAAGAGAAGGVGAGVGPAGGTSGAAGGNGAASPAGVGDVGAGGAAGTGAATGGTGAVPVGSGGPARPRPYFVPLLEQVLGLPPSPGPAPPLEYPQPVQSQSPLQPVSPLPAPSPYAGPTGGLAERREPASRPASPDRTTRTSRRAPRPRPPAVPGTHQMTLRPSTAPLRVLLPSPPESSLPVLADPASDSLRAASPTVARLLTTVVTDPSFESTAASALVAQLVDFAARCRLDYATSLVAESASVCPPSVGGECALSTDVLEDRQEEFQCFAAVLPHLVSTLLAPEGDPDAPDIPTPRSYAEAIKGPYSSQWQSAMDAEMASWKSTGTYVDEVPPPGANIVSGMWIFRVKRPPGSPPVFKARYVARGFSQRQGVDYFQTFSPTSKMTTLRVLLHVAAQRDYELHSLDFSTAFLQGSLHEEIWLRRPPGFTGSFPPGTHRRNRSPVHHNRLSTARDTNRNHQRPRHEEPLGEPLGAVRDQATVQLVVPPQDRRSNGADESDDGAIDSCHVRRPDNMGAAVAADRVRVQQRHVSNDAARFT
ncbi:unnamed protein product [Closterium sp. NIES-53]